MPNPLRHVGSNNDESGIWSKHWWPISMKQKYFALPKKWYMIRIITPEKGLWLHYLVFINHACTSIMCTFFSVQFEIVWRGLINHLALIHILPDSLAPNTSLQFLFDSPPLTSMCSHIAPPSLPADRENPPYHTWPLLTMHIRLVLVQVQFVCVPDKNIHQSQHTSAWHTLSSSPPGGGWDQRREVRFLIFPWCSIVC